MDSLSQRWQDGDNGPATGGNQPAFLFSAMIAIDASAISLWLANWISTSQLFALHISGVGLSLLVSVLLHPRTHRPALLEAGFCVLAGPLGTIVLQIARLGEVPPTADPADPEDMDSDALRAISVPDAIHEMHVQGRRSKSVQVEDQSYAHSIRRGDLRRHNEVIAAISRNYKPEMYRALTLALGSSNPALKVQAAAVFSKLRRTLGEAANDLLSTRLISLTPDTAKDHQDRLLEVARSGFVDASKAQALMARARAIDGLGLLSGARSSSPETHVRPAKHVQPDLRLPRPRLKRYSCGGLG